MALVRTASGRRYSNRDPLSEPLHEPATPVDHRVRLPLKDRKVRREVLRDGTISISYEDPPLGSAPVPDDGGDLPPPPEALEEPETSPEEQSRELDRKKGLR